MILAPYSIAPRASLRGHSEPVIGRVRILGYDFVSTFWLLEHQDESAEPRRVVPDGRSELILNWSQPFEFFQDASGMASRVDDSLGRDCFGDRLVEMMELRKRAHDLWRACNRI
jgi:hypothetical protein